MTSRDLKLAQNDLRMEVKANYNLIKKVCEKNDINANEKTFGEFLNIDLCYNVIIEKYKYFIDEHELDFYSYKSAKEKILQSQKLTAKQKDNLIEYISKAVKQQGRSTKDKREKEFSYHFRRLLKDEGIFYYFIPSSWEIDYLTSPVKLLYKKLEEAKEHREHFK